MSTAVKIPVRITVDEFLLWDPDGDQRWQLVDGEPQAMAPTSRTHGSMQAELCWLFRQHLLAKGGPCVVVAAPGIIPRVRPGFNYRIPDLAVNCTSYAVEEYGITDPVLIVEILSPSNQSATWSNVFTYCTIPSVREVVILRSTSIGAELLRRQANGDWPLEPDTITAGDLTLDSIGLTLPLLDVYRTTRLYPSS